MCLFTAMWCAAAFAEAPRLERHELVKMGSERILGAAWEGESLYTWGDRLLRWRLASRKPEVLRGAGNPFGEGGAVFDFDGDGTLDLIVNESGAKPALVWFRGPRWSRRVIEEGVETPDIAPAAIHGRRGVLVIHRGMQVRFYEIGSARDLYSFYSPSLQSGFLIRDIDGDGRPDIVCGNYWMQNPPEFELSWRLYAIRAWSEEKLSARSVFAWWGGRLVVAQSEMTDARLAWFEQPADPKLLWEEHRIEGDLHLAEPHSLAVADFNSDGKPGLLVAERAGSGRLVLFGEGPPAVLAHSSGILWMRAMDWDRDGHPDVLAIDRQGIAWWRLVR